MSIKSNKQSRGLFLRGAMGSTLALPFLESIAQAKPNSPSKKCAFFYVPIGVVRNTFFPGESDVAVKDFNSPNNKAYQGAEMKVGWHSFPQTPTLKPLNKLKNKVTLVTNLDRTFQDGTDVHAQCASCFLSSAAPYFIKQSAWPLDRTLDQIIADEIGNETPFKSLEFSCNSHKDNKESMHFDNISWYGTGHVSPSMRDPRKAYQRIFQNSNQKNFKNVTDLVLQDANFMKRQLGYEDSHKFNEYYESIRAIETQMDRMEKMRDQLKNIPLAEPTDSYLPRGQYIELMSEIMIVALQTGITNVASLMVGPERWDTPYTFESLFDRPMSHHQMSHNPSKHEKNLQKVDLFYMQAFANMVTKMDKIKESDGSSLLHNTLFTYGSGLGDGSTHQYNDLPIVVAGTGGGKFKSGGHLHMPNETPLANLWLTQAQSFGVKRDTFADSQGHLSEILV